MLIKMLLKERVLYIAKLPKSEAEIKIFSSKQKLKEIITTALDLQETLKGVTKYETKKQHATSSSCRKIQGLLIKVNTWTNIVTCISGNLGWKSVSSGIAPN
jgi:hypothetical protein